MLQRVSQAEQKKQKRPFGPGAEDGGAGSGDEHQEIDLELCVRDFLNCFFQCEEAAKDVSADEQEDGKPARDNAELWPQPPNDQQGAAGQGKYQLEIVGFAVIVLVGRIRLMCGRFN